MGNLTLSVPTLIYYVYDEEDGKSDILLSIMQNEESKIKRFLSYKLKSQFEADDIFQEALVFLSNKDGSNCIDPLKYVWGCIQIMLKRHFSNVAKERKVITFNSPENYINYYNEEDTVENAYLSDYIYSNSEIEERLNNLEYLRYEYGYDIFSVIYLRLRIKDNEKFERVLKYNYNGIEEIKGINSYKIKKIISMILQSNAGIVALRKFIYCADNIDNIIDNM